MTSQFNLNLFNNIDTSLQKIENLITFILVAAILLISSNSQAYFQQAEPESSAAQQNDTSESNDKIKWPIDLQLLEQQNNADDSFWLQLEQEKTLVLKYFAKGRKLRGNVLLLHTEGENPQHIRIIDPLSRQLSRLGWQVWIPTLPVSDFPIEKPVFQNSNSNAQPAETDSTNASNPPTQQSSGSTQSTADPNADPNATSTQNSSSKNEDNYFKTVESYQTFFSQLIAQIIGDAAGSPGQFAIVTNQTSAFWILPTVSSDQRINQLIMISPQLPKGVTTDLGPLFQTQNKPVYTFIDDEISSLDFEKAFQKQLWRSSFQRLNRGMIDNLKYNSEDVTVAKSITGWIESQLKTKK